MFSGGLGEVTHSWGTLETVTILGYPIYFLTLIGVWKILGAVAIIVPSFPRLKEWAYAGIFFNMTGAVISHLAAGNYGIYFFHLFITISLAVLDVVSWALRPQGRILGVLFPNKLRF